MHITLNINPLGKQKQSCSNIFNRLIEDVELWRRENPYATMTEVSQSTILTNLNKSFYFSNISYVEYNILWYYLYHGHMQYRASNQMRTGMAELDTQKKAYCYGIIDIIQDEMVMLKNVYVNGINSNEENISFMISHVWINTMGVKQAIAGNRLHVGDYIKFRGRPYQYKRNDNTKDYSFSNTNNRKIQLISKEEYLYNMNIGMEAIL